MSNFTDSLLHDGSNEYEHSEVLTDSLRQSLNSTDLKPNLLLSTLSKKTSRLKQPKEAQERFLHTLAGFIISLLRDTGPMKQDEIVQSVDQVKHTLRKVDGKFYKENTRKVVLATICGSNIFELRDDMVYLNEEKARYLEHKTINSIQRRMEKSKNLPSDDLPIKVSCRRLDKVIIMFEKFCNKLKTDQHYRTIIKDPIKALTGEEDLLQAINKLGHDRLLGMLQCFCMLKPYCNCYIDNSLLDESNSARSSGLHEMNEKLSRISEQINRMEHNMVTTRYDRFERTDSLPIKKHCQE